MPATMCSLPEDLIEDIISRLPMKDMRAVRLTCKKWEILSKSRSFTKMHIGKLGQVSRMVVLMDHSVYLMSNVVDGDPPSTERQGKLACLDDSGQVIRFSQIFYCDGLVLCILEDDTRVVVWNPYWGQTRWIQPAFSYRINQLDRFTYALGYEDTKSRRRHKFLRFIDIIDSRPFGPVDPLVQASLKPLLQVYEIYDFDSDTWKTLAVDDPHWRKPYSAVGVSLKGNTYWCATERNARIPHRLGHIICFDFTRERFGPLLPLPKNGMDGLVTLSCVQEEKLAALFYYGHHYPIEIWITSKVVADTEISWTKLFTLETGLHPSIRIHLVRATFFVDEEKRVALVFDQVLGRDSVIIIGDSGSVRVVDLGHRTQQVLPLMRPYVPSSVQVKQPARRKRKRQQACLERRRYYQNMLKHPMLEPFAGTGKKTKTAKLIRCGKQADQMIKSQFTNSNSIFIFSSPLLL